ncbi:hypothetical protein I3843_11G079600 [Carya illinoinensis]|uniref:DM2 domain-containing protein n=1 Tax=Carya illinoinensis TaxID=32201 RepID=A0A8T1NWD5_CARIL|nr:uncharacterized protein LOC122280374 [Carya illinoinensis]KAG2680043.1 hypothetical protein I3760_11G079700 [Carya illinoinensis]KAG6635899.1 hypothetical protein CIPAW_11G075100 [Carya illinoinensis]KAG6687595.1 hypothetical protein I3842_11G080200 [Carya illinoinensis]KAG7955576.1 hypothetical protein I3843_11G079600 [Carya illinoinensis]
MGMGMAGMAVRVLAAGSRSMSTKAHNSIPKEIAKAINPKTASSEFRKFLGIPHSSRSQNALLISKFIRLYNFRSPGIKKDNIWEENLNKMLQGKDRVGLPEIAKLLSPQFNQKGGMNAVSNSEDSKQQMGNVKGKAKKKGSKKK